MTNSEELYHNAPVESDDLTPTHYAEYLAAEQQEVEQEPKAVADLILHSDCSKSANEYRGYYMAKRVHDGEINALEFAVKGRAMLKSIEAALDATKEDTIREIAKHGKKAEMYGSEIEVKEAGVKYSYEHCGDHMLQELTAKMDALMADIKKRQNFLKTLTGSTTLVDEQTGEVYTVHPPRKTSTTTYQITHK